MSNAYRRFQLNHGFFSLLGANMHPCWHPKSMKNRKKEVPEGVQKAFNFQDHFCPLLVLSWEPTWLQVGAQDRPRRRPRAPKSRPGRPPRQPRDPLEAQSAPNTPRTSKITPGPSKMTQFSWILRSICVDFRRIFDQVLERFCLHAWLRAD